MRSEGLQVDGTGFPIAGYFRWTLKSAETTMSVPGKIIEEVAEGRHNQRHPAA
jgi:hypothetical protein